jgi:hypothetical protein
MIRASSFLLPLLCLRVLGAAELKPPASDDPERRSQLAEALVDVWDFDGLYVSAILDSAVRNGAVGEAQISDRRAELIDALRPMIHADAVAAFRDGLSSEVMRGAIARGASADSEAFWREFRAVNRSMNVVAEQRFGAILVRTKQVLAQAAAPADAPTGKAKGDF